MEALERETRCFQAGGAVREESCYVEREADDALYSALDRGEFCYVFGTTQIGKSSLKVHTKRRFERAGTKCVAFDPPSPDDTTQEYLDRWYYTIASIITDGAKVEVNLDDAWGRLASRTPDARWLSFMTDTLIPRLDGRLIVFIDEVNILLETPELSNTFFATIRQLNDKRALDTSLDRITFCVLGIASPAALVRSPERSPFRNATKIELLDFTLQETTESSLKVPLSGLDVDVIELLDNVHAWTSGHPYMTQRVCDVLATHECQGTARKRVDDAVRLAFLEGEKDANLNFAERYVRAPNNPGQAILELYESALQGQPVEHDGDSEVHKRALLSGLLALRKKDGADKPLLVVRNRIFGERFNLAWVKQQQTNSVLHGMTQWRDAPEAKRWLYLLRGPELTRALKWADGKNLDAEEEEFLRRSQARQTQSVRHGGLVLMFAALALAAQAVWVIFTLDAQDKKLAQESQRLRAEAVAGEVVDHLHTLSGYVSAVAAGKEDGIQDRNQTLADLISAARHIAQGDDGKSHREKLAPADWEKLAPADWEKLDRACEKAYYRYNGGIYPPPIELWHILDEDGTAVGQFSIPRRDRKDCPKPGCGFHGERLSGRDYFLGAQKLGQSNRPGIYVSSAYRSTTNDRWAVALAAPIFDRTNKFAGVLVASSVSDLNIGLLKLDNDQSFASLVVPRDPTSDHLPDKSPPPRAAGPDDYVFLRQPGMLHGDIREFSNPTIRRFGTDSRRVLNDYPEAWEKPLPWDSRSGAITDYQDPLNSGPPRTAGYAAVAQTGYVVIVEPKKEYAERENTERRVSLSIAFTLPVFMLLGMLFVFSPDWWDRLRALLRRMLN